MDSFDNKWDVLKKIWGEIKLIKCIKGSKGIVETGMLPYWQYNWRGDKRRGKTAVIDGIEEGSYVWLKGLHGDACSDPWS